MSVDKNKESSSVFHIQRIYVKDISFSSPKSPSVFNQSWKPEVSFEVSTNHVEIKKNVYEVYLSLRIENKIENEVVFTCNVVQAGIFTIENLSEQDLEHTLGSYCPSTIYPYAREAVSSLVVKGSFPQLNLGPINFDAFYAAKKEKELAEKENQSSSQSKSRKISDIAANKKTVTEEVDGN